MRRGAFAAVAHPRAIEEQAMDERAAMERAVELAVPHHPHPNPRVGSVVLDSAGNRVGEGAHHAAGTPHAEFHALDEAGARAAGGTIVVTLEPCAHEGRTAPCVDQIIGAGISRAIIGTIDPDERVSGRGVEALRSAGIEVVVGMGEDLAVSVDPGYLHHRRTGRPRVTLKLASTLDGQVAAADGSSRWITSPEARRDAHLLRSVSDSVAVGAGTVAVDDPHLGVRLDGFSGRQPRPVVIVGSRPLPRTAVVFGRDPLVYATEPLDLPGEMVALPGEGGVDLPSAIADLGKRQIVDLLVEGGPRLASALVSEGLVDRYVFYLAAAVAAGTGVPAFIGSFPSMGDEVRLEIVDVRRVGPDMRVEAQEAR